MKKNFLSKFLLKDYEFVKKVKKMFAVIQVLYLFFVFGNWFRKTLKDPFWKHDFFFSMFLQNQAICFFVFFQERENIYYLQKKQCFLLRKEEKNYLG